jgi:DNA polymerase II large subunit
VAEILYLGDILFSYGDFSENNHMLVPAGYTEEWWHKELEKAAVDMFGTIDKDKIAEFTGIDSDAVERLLQNPRARLSARAAIVISQKLSIPLHPEYSYFWKLITTEQLSTLIGWVALATVHREDNKITKMVMQLDKETKPILETLGIPHLVASNEFVVLEHDHATSLLHSLGLRGQASGQVNHAQTVLENIAALSGIRVRDLAGTFIGARMGRPEKAKMRKMAGSPQVLFPIGDEGGRLRSFQSAMENGKVTADFPIYHCDKCDKRTIYATCESCGQKPKKLYHCPKCATVSENKDCGRHGPCKSHMKQQIDIKRYFMSAFALVGDRVHPDLIKGVRGTSNHDHIPEHIIKGILRAKHDVYVNKDGTVRFDMTELPMTHFKPEEICTSVDRLKELGYTHDVKGNSLTSDKQILEIKPQDLVLPAGTEAMDEQADKVLVRVADFIDELLVKLYKQEPYYRLSTKEELVGHMVIGLAPHISAGTVGRIIGFSRTQGMFAHPLYHAAMRRDCDGDEACVILLLDGLLNFSRQYLPDSRGAKTMDAPLVLTSRLIPTEVDDMAHGLDIVWDYPLELYNAAQELTPASGVKVEQIRHCLNTERQYEGMGFTHQTTDINEGVNCSAYKALPSMEEKLKGQMVLAERIRAVDASDVARLVIEKHLLRDTKGNLRKFSTQQFRCIKCNEKHRRPPLSGKCSCGGRILFTVSHGSVVKYLEPTLSLAEKYHLHEYLQQTLKLLQLRIDGVFGKEREIQEGLGRWF